MPTLRAAALLCARARRSYLSAAIASATAGSSTLMEKLDEMAEVAKLRAALLADASVDQPALFRLGHLYGSLDKALACYLREGHTRFNQAVAVQRVKNTLAHRAQHRLDEHGTDLQHVMDAHPVRAAWPAAFARIAPDGCPVVYCRLSRVNLTALESFPEHELQHFVALWCERALQLVGDSSGARDTLTTGTYEIYARPRTLRIRDVPWGHGTP